MRSTWRCLVGSTTAIVALAASSVRADHAGDHAWTGQAGDGTFDTAGNWDPAVVPGEDDAALFGLDAVYTIAFGANHTNDRLLVRDGAVTLHLFTGTVFGTPRTYTLTDAEASLVVGEAGDDEAALTLRLGTLNSATASIGLEAGSLGEVVVTGSAFWTSSGALYVGSEGTGRLTIDGGTVTNTDFLQGSVIGRLANSDGTVTVTGGNSEWVHAGSLFVGGQGTGTLTIDQGGSVSSARGRVGHGGDGEGLAIVRGEGSQWTNDDNLLVGNFGKGELRVLVGGSVTSTAGAVGWSDANAEGTVNVRGEGATWTNDGTLTIGGFGTGTLAISDGGAVESTNGRIGFADGSRGSVLVTSEGSAWTISGELRVGEEGIGTLTVTDGGRVENTTGRIGADAGSDGSVTVQGEGTNWTNGGQLFVGEEGDGTLRIEDGGHVQSSTSTVGRQADAEGTVVVIGADAEWTVSGTLNVGNFGTAEMTIEGGGHVSNTASGRIALNSGSEGAVTVTGQDSIWASGSNLEVGGSGTGTLTIEAGGSATGTLGQIAVGTDSEGTAVVSGQSSSWTSTQSLIVGSRGKATLTVSDGGSVSNTAGLIGHMAGSTGTVTVSGADATWTNSFSTRVGEEGVGTLAIEAGGRVSTDTDGTIGRFGGSSGIATVGGAGSSWTIGGQLGIGGNPALGANGGAGTLTIISGGSVSIAEETVLFPDALLRLEVGTLSTAAIEFQGGGQFQWTGGTLHVDTYHGDLVNQGGTLAPGRSAGTTTILGDYTQQTAAALQIEIGGLLAGSEHDLVSITGNAILGGELQLVLLDDFLPNADDQFTVLSVLGGIAGVFSNVTTGQRLETIDGLGSFLVHYGAGSALDPNQIVLTGFEAATIPGDFNGDGVVDAADYTVWRDGLGGPFDEADYDVWQANFGTVAAAAVRGLPSQAAIPEPGTLALLAIGAAPLAWRRRQRGSIG